MTPEEELVAGGTLAGIGIGMIVAFLLVWYVLQVIADWKILSKAKKPGWQSLIPILNLYAEYSICWSGGMGLLYGILFVACSVVSSIGSDTALIISLILGVIALVISIIQSFKLAKAFGKGAGYGIFLVILGPLARVILGFGKSEYVGNK